MILQFKTAFFGQNPVLAKPQVILSSYKHNKIFLRLLSTAKIVQQQQQDYTLSQ